MISIYGVCVCARARGHACVRACVCVCGGIHCCSSHKLVEPLVYQPLWRSHSSRRAPRGKTPAGHVFRRHQGDGRRLERDDEMLRTPRRWGAGSPNAGRGPQRRPSWGTTGKKKKKKKQRPF